MDLQKIEAVIRPVVEHNGFKLYDLEFHGRILRVSIDKAGGVSIEDCVATSRLLNPLLDVEDIVPGSYELEVSSPGLDRNLRRPEHFQSVIGEKIHVTTKEPFSIWNGDDLFYANRRNMTGVLEAFDGEWLTMTSMGKPAKIPLNEITRAYVEFELKTTPKKGKKD